MLLCHKKPPGRPTHGLNLALLPTRMFEHLYRKSLHTQPQNPILLSRQRLQPPDLARDLPLQPTELICGILQTPRPLQVAQKEFLERHTHATSVPPLLQDLPHLLGLGLRMQVVQKREGELPFVQVFAEPLEGSVLWQPVSIVD
jgi:hypothetical protein